MNHGAKIEKHEALLSIVCNESGWTFDGAGGQSIKFTADGTGELWCRIELCVFIAAAFEWQSLRSQLGMREVEVVQRPQPPPSNHMPHEVGHLRLQIKLLDQIPASVAGAYAMLSRSTILNGRGLADDAFKPKTHLIRIEKGNFMPPVYSGYPDPQHDRYALRLIFEKSPYPPREEWKQPEGGPDSNNFWDHVEFVGMKSKDLSKRTRAMNDLSPTWAGTSCFIP